MSSSKESIIGIDLGTTYSCVSIMRNGKVEIIPDRRNVEKVIPSIVCFKSLNECLIGVLAKNNMTQYYKSTMFDSKRLLGLEYKNKEVQEDIKRWFVKVIEDPETKKPQYVIDVEGKERKYSPEDVSSMILNDLKLNAEKFENKNITKAVITVPAHFNNYQREATIEAAKLAGLEVYKLINEPTAAAIACAFENNNKEKNILIFDLGGGTFDVTILKNKGNEYNVLSSVGEQHLGGEDFNQRLMNYVINEIKKKDKFKNIDFYNRDDDKTLNSLKRITMEIEKVKLELSSAQSSSFFLDTLHGIENIDLLIDRKEFEILCEDLWEKCLKKIEHALRLTNLKKEKIDEIILVGGSTKIPKVKEMVKNFFNGKEPLENVNALEIVAKGAVLAAYSDIKVNDVTSKAIGIQISDGKMDIIIPTKTVLPGINEKRLKYIKEYTLRRNDSVKTKEIKIYQGNEENVSENELLGKFTVRLMEINQDTKVKITMLLDHNSILLVEAFVNNEKNVETKLKIEKKFSHD